MRRLSLSLSLSLRDAVDVKIELDSGSPVFLFPRVSIYSRMIEKMRDKVRLLSSGSISFPLSVSFRTYATFRARLRTTIVP